MMTSTTATQQDDRKPLTMRQRLVRYKSPCWDDRTNVGYPAHNHCPTPDGAREVCMNCGDTIYLPPPHRRVL